MTTGTNVVTTDPVCGMQVHSGKEAGSFAVKGKTYLFCSKHCLQVFSAVPERYLGKRESAGSGHAVHSPHAHANVKPVGAPAPAGARYTCPMHPEILRDAPGDCPLCGMALVPIAGTGASDDSELRDLTRRLWFGVALSVPLVVLAMAPMLGVHEAFSLAPRARNYFDVFLDRQIFQIFIGNNALRESKPGSFLEPHQHMANGPHLSR